jgi:hypothetical protein
MSAHELSRGTGTRVTVTVNSGFEMFEILAGSRTVLPVLGRFLRSRSNPSLLCLQPSTPNNDPKDVEHPMKDSSTTGR